MNLNSLKKLICFLLAVLMLLSTVGCKDKTTKKKKKVIKKKVIVVNNDDTTSEDDIIDEDDDDEDVIEKVRPERKLPEVAESDKVVILDDPKVDEFDHVYKDFTLNKDAVIIYGYTEWDNRYEGYTNYKKELATNNTKRVIEYTAENRLAANDLKTYFKDNYNINLDVYLDTAYAEKVASGDLTGSEQKIIVGDSKYFTSKLGESEFAVKLEGDNLVFEGGHYAMVESAVDWFRSVEIEKGKVATLTSKNINFKSQIVLNGVTYDYIWGDEFDGYEFNDDEKWAQSTFGLERQDDMANIFDDPHFQYVENGKVRLSGDRYYDEGNAKIGYATSGQIDSNSSAIFRNGYFEFYARLPYRRGGFPAIWTMTADAECRNVYNYSIDDGFGVYRDRLWDLEFDLFESFADADHMTTTIHKWYTPKYTDEDTYTTRTSFGMDNKKLWQDLTLEEERMVEADLANAKGNSEKRYNWTVEDPTKRAKDSWKACTLHKTDKKGEDRCLTYYYVDDKGTKDTADDEKITTITYNGKAVPICETLIAQQITDINTKKDPDDTSENPEMLYTLNAEGNDIIATWGKLRELGLVKGANDDKEKKDTDEATLKELQQFGILKANHQRQAIIFHFNDGTTLDIFKYRLSPFTNMGGSMATYAYSFSYTGNKGSYDRRQDPNGGLYGDWRWYFNAKTINNEYHLYSFHYTSDHCTVSMDGVPFLDFDWDPAYDYKDTDGDGKGNDISNNNNGVGFNFWQYFLIDMMIYTPGNFNIDGPRKIQVGDCPFHLYIDYIRFYQDLDDPSQGVHFINDAAVK